MPAENYFRGRMHLSENRLFYRKALGWMLLFLAGAVVLLYAHFCDGVDPDATSYLTLARRWARGAYAPAINGYWSPFSIWLTALGMRAGLPEIPAAFVQNTLGAGLFAAASLVLFRQFRVSETLLRRVLPGFAFFLLHAVFLQWFSDLWGAGFALLALAVLLRDGFFRKPGLWFLYGALGALAYLSKSLYLPFFIVQTLLAVGLVKNVPVNRKAFLTLSAFGTLGLLCAPWWQALREHYGFWTTGVAGPLNLSWGVVGHPLFKEAVQPLLPPLFPDSVSFWEDPWWVNARLVHFWDSPAQFVHMLPRFGYFFLRLLNKAVLLSLFLPVALWHVATQLSRNRFRLSGDFKDRMLPAVLLLFPLPFLMVHSEVRYLWFLAPLTVVLIQRHLLDRHFHKAVAVLLAVSFCVYPAMQFPALWHLGRKEKALAAHLKAQGISGDFAADTTIGYSEALRVACFSGMRYWAPAEALSDSALQSAMHRNGIEYLLKKEGMQKIKH